MAHLYVNSKGFEVRSHSYSAGSLFRECAQKYKLARLDGWKEREQRASMEFGKAIESAIQFHHLNKLSGGHEEFSRLWELQRGRDLKYTASEGNWENLAKSGVEMLKLYHTRLPLFPFDLSTPPEFQIKYYKEMFPGTDMSGIEFVAFIDMRVRSKLSLGDALGIDIKTSGKLIPDMLGLDPQLCAYAWVTGIPDWGFLNLIKTNRSIEKGDYVALLEPTAKFFAGQTVVVAAMDKGDENAPGDLAWLVTGERELEAVQQAQGYKNGKLEQTNAAKERKLAWLKENAVRIPTNVLTKQQIQFVHTHIGLAEQLEASKKIAHDTVQIVYSNNENYWPKEGGIRFPNDKCVRCSMRGLCLGNSELNDQLVFRTDEEWDISSEEES